MPAWIISWAPEGKKTCFYDAPLWSLVAATFFQEGDGNKRPSPRSFIRKKAFSYFSCCLRQASARSRRAPSTPTRSQQNFSTRCLWNRSKNPANVRHSCTMNREKLDEFLADMNWAPPSSLVGAELSSASSGAVYCASPSQVAAKQGLCQHELLAWFKRSANLSFACLNLQQDQQHQQRFCFTASLLQSPANPTGVHCEEEVAVGVQQLLQFHTEEEDHKVVTLQSQYV